MEPKTKLTKEQEDAIKNVGKKTGYGETLVREYVIKTGLRLEVVKLSKDIDNGKVDLRDP